MRNIIRLRAFITSPELQQRHYSRTAKDLVDVFRTFVFRQYYVHNHVSHLYRATYKLRAQLSTIEDVSHLYHVQSQFGCGRLGAT